MKYLAIMGGGALGALARYVISGFTHEFFTREFPYGTLVVNVSGCLLIGFLMTLSEERFVFTPDQRLFIFIGVLGAFTTFSTFGYETMGLIRRSEWLFALLNVSLSLIAGLGAIYVGDVLARLLTRR